MEFVNAKLNEAELLIALINDSYEVERGDTGVSFKNSNRIHTNNELDDAITQNRVIKAVIGDECVGCIVWEESDEALFFGPLAVSTKHQGKGIGKALIHQVELLCREKNKLRMEMCVVNHRTDLIPMYEKFGFVNTGKTDPYYEPHYLTRPSHFMYFTKILQ